MIDEARTAEVFERIAALQDDVVAATRRLVKIPSIAGDHDAAERAVALVAELCGAAGLAAERWSGGGAPAVFAELAAPPGAPTVLFYGHYDVQPADPLDAWDSPPFAPVVRNGALYGRGAGDNKGQFVAHLFALRALHAAGGCPVGVKLLIEGEEEIGSPTLPALVAARRGRLACDVAVTADGPYHAGGSPLVILGVRGLLYVELSVRGAARDLHSGAHGGNAPAPARTLARALAGLWDERGRATVPGFYDDVVAPDDDERELAQRLAAASAGADALDATGWQRLMFEPNINIAGIDCGYIGAGVKTVIPHRAGAKIDIRLVAGQDPERIYRRLRVYFAEHGIEATRLAAVPPSRTPLDNPYLAPVRGAIAAAWRREPLVQPRLGGTTPDFVFTRTLGVPSLLVPYAPADMHHHAPNERMPIAALLRGARTSAAICLALGGMARAAR